MVFCGSSPRGTMLRPVVLGAWIACLSLAMMAVVEAQGPQNVPSGLEMLRNRANPVSAEDFLRAELDIEKAVKDVEKIDKMTNALSMAGMGGIGASAIGTAITGLLARHDAKADGSQGMKKKTKFAGALSLLLFLGGTASTVTSYVLQFTKAKKLRKELELANQKSAALKELLMASLAENAKEGEQGEQEQDLWN
eukprot:Lankesteria_metandrocarpae@DN6282_c0_g1_i1.p1